MWYVVDLETDAIVFLAHNKAEASKEVSEGNILTGYARYVLRHS